MDKIVRAILGATLVALLSGCSSVSTSPAILVNIPPADNTKWTMDVYQKNDTGSATIALYINGTILGTNDWSHIPANITGTYANHAVQAVCSITGSVQRQGISAPLPSGTCVVYVDGTQVATLPY